MCGVASSGEPGAREGEGDAGGVDGDPAAALLLGDGSSGARATGGVEHEVPGVSGHEDAALHNFLAGLDDIYFVLRKSCHFHVRPIVINPYYIKILQISLIHQGLTNWPKTSSFCKSSETPNIRLKSSR